MKHLFAVALALPLCGCFQVDQSLTVNSRDDAVFAVSYGLEAGILEMSEGSREGFCGDPTDVPAGLAVETDTYAEGSLRVCEIIFTGSIDSIMEMVNRESPLLGDAEGDASAQARFSLTLDGDTYLYSVYLPFDMGSSDMSPEQEQMMRSMVLAASAGRALEFTVTAPQIISTNGRIVHDGTMARLSVPVAELFGGSTPAAEFEVEFAL